MTMLVNNPINVILRDYPLLILDGALATELEWRGCDLRDPLWSAKMLFEQPDLIRAVHADYFAAGADCAITASYQATFAGFAQRGFDQPAATELLGRAVRLALEARDSFWAEPANRSGRPKPLVAASIGPYGAYLADGSEYRGRYSLSSAELIEFHRPRMAALVEAGADLLACETIPCIEEARALALLLPEFPRISAWVSFSARDAAHTCQGEPLADCAAELAAHPQVAAIGVNCTAPRYVPALIAAVRRVTDKPIVAYPNSGEIYDVTTNAWSGETACADFGAQALAWHAAGARLIGGCCRTTPAHIREVAQRMRPINGL